MQCILKIIVLLIRNKSPKGLNHFPHRTIYLFSAYCSIFPYDILLNKLFSPQVTEQSIYFPFSFADLFATLFKENAFCPFKFQTSSFRFVVQFITKLYLQPSLTKHVTKVNSNDTIHQQTLCHRNTSLRVNL